MQVHLGQQAIVAHDGTPQAYELLFRPAAGASSAQVEDGEHATARVLVATFLEFGLGELVGDLPAFVNVPRGFLTGELALPFPPGQVVLEVLEDVPADQDVVAGIERLVAAGYRIALDDVTSQRSRADLLHLASYVKLDLLATDLDDLPGLVTRSRGTGRHVIAEKVETVEQLERCRSLGVELFQGYLFSRPRTLSRRSVSPAQLACLRLLGVLARADAPTREVVDAVEADPALALKVLRAANSAGTGLRRQLSSVEEAVILVGRQTLLAWTALVALNDGGDDPSRAAALARARMCQLLAQASGADASAAFLAGLLSSLAGPLGLTLPALLAQVPVSTQVRTALVAGHGPLADLLERAQAYERCAQVGDLDATRSAYVRALAWSTGTGRAVVPT